LDTVFDAETGKQIISNQALERSVKFGPKSARDANTLAALRKKVVGLKRVKLQTQRQVKKKTQEKQDQRYVLQKARKLQVTGAWDKRRKSNQSQEEVQQAFEVVKDWVQKRLKGQTAKGTVRKRGTTAECDVLITQLLAENNIRHKNVQGTVAGMWHLFFGREMDFQLYSRTQIGEISEAIPALIKEQDIKVLRPNNIAGESVLISESHRFGPSLTECP